MNKFFKVSKEQFVKDHESPNAYAQWCDLKLPSRATKFSSGYDFYSPFDFCLKPHESIKIPTGIKVELDEDKFLMLIPRSGLGFKYKMQLWDTVGDIDADYIFSDNEGHIFAKICNGNDERSLFIKQGEAFMQGIILNYNKTEADVSEEIRNGGFGSTTEKTKGEIT